MLSKLLHPGWACRTRGCLSLEPTFDCVVRSFYRIAWGSECSYGAES